MRFVSVALLVLAFSSLSFAAKNFEQFSANCKNWKPVSKDEKERAGFIKSGDQLLYFDVATNIWISLGKAPLVFISKDSEVFSVTSSSLETLTHLTKRPDTIAGLMLKIEDVGQEMASKPRWTLAYKENQTRLYSFLTASKQRCSLESKVDSIICKSNGSCSIHPDSKLPGVAKACAKEFGLLEPGKLQGIRNGCAFISNDENYAQIVKQFNAAAKACAMPAAKFDSLTQFKKICADSVQLVQMLTEQ